MNIGIQNGTADEPSLAGDPLELGYTTVFALDDRVLMVAKVEFGRSPLYLGLVRHINDPLYLGLVSSDSLDAVSARGRERDQVYPATYFRTIWG